MITEVKWAGWQYTGDVTKKIEAILKSTPTIKDQDYTVNCSFGFGPTGGFCVLDDDPDQIGLAYIISKTDLKTMLNKVLDAILDMENSWSPGKKMFKRTTMNDVKIVSDTGCIWISLKY